MFGASMMNTAAGLASLIAGFGSSIIVARVLGVNGSGIVAYALWIMTAATLVSDLGVALLQERNVIEHAENTATKLALQYKFVAVIIETLKMGKSGLVVEPAQSNPVVFH